MSKVIVELNREAVFEIMKSDEVVDFIQKKADDIVGKCQKGSYETNQWIGKHRANVSIVTRDKDTYFRNLESNELIKALK